MGQELCGLDLAGSYLLTNLTELAALLVGDGGAQILNLGAVACGRRRPERLRKCPSSRSNRPAGVESQQSVGFLRVSTAKSSSTQQAARPSDFPNGIDVGDELVWSDSWSRELDLQVTPRVGEFDAVVLAERSSSCDPLLQHAIPGVAVRVVRAWF